MKTWCSQNTHKRGFLGIMLLGLLALLMIAENAHAQSTDRDNPTPLTANEFKGHAIGKKVEYYFTFLAGPGDLVITIDGGAKGSFSEYRAELFNLDAEKLGQVQILPYPGETARRVTRVTFGAQQPVLLRLVLDYDAAQFMVRVGGAVQLDSAATLSATPVASDASTQTAGTPADSSTPPPASTGTTPPVTPTETPVTATEATTTPQPTDGKMSGFQKLWLRLGAAGEMLGLAKIGKLKIEMKDGTSQEVGLLKVKKIFAPKGEDPASASPANESWQRLWMKLGNAGELMNLAASGAMRVELQDGSMQQYDLTKIKKVSIKK
jgi:hypothetical protein